MATQSYDRWNYPQKMVQGDTWTFAYQVAVRDPDTGVITPVDISTWTFTGWVGETRTSATVTDMTVTVVNASEGRVKFSIANTNTELFPLGTLYYQIRSTVAGEVQTMFKGPFQVV